MDWNWFFSSLAQSAAAIVGIFAAFIITKILSNQSTFDEKNRRLRLLIVDAQKICDDAEDRYFNWYNNRVADEEYASATEKLDRDPSLSAEALYSVLTFSPFMPRERVVTGLQKLVIGQQRRVAQKRSAQKRYDEDFPGSSAPMLYDTLQMPRAPDHNRNQVEAERENIDAVLRAARHHIRTCNEFLHSVDGDPESSRQISWVLILVTALFFAGVIYPLSFMPLPAGAPVQISLSAIGPTLCSLRGFLLILVAGIFTTALGMFFQMNRSMKYDPAKVNELAAFTRLGKYSGYFAIYEANMARSETSPDPDEASDDSEVED